MKIAVYFNLPAGGAKRILFEQVKRLSETNEIDVYTLSMFRDDFLSLKPYSKNYFIYKFSDKSKLPFFLSRIQSDYKDLFSLRKVHKKIAKAIDSRNYDLVFVHTDVLTEAPFLLRYLQTPKAYYCEELLRIAYEPELTTEGKLHPINRFYESFLRKIKKGVDKRNVQKSDLILTTSNFMKRKIKQAYDRKAIVCYPGVDCEVFKPRNVIKRNQVLFIGNKTKIDGYFLVLEALRKIPKEIRPSLKVLNFYKDGPEIKNDSELAREYSRSLLTICADVAEPFGLKVLESCACGTPVIAVNDGGYKETVVDGVNGFLIEKNSQSLSKKILYLIKNKDKYLEISTRSKEHVSNLWNWKEKIDCLNLIFSHIKKPISSSLLISLLDSGGIGGSEFFIFQLAKSLEERDIKVTIVTYKGSEVIRLLRKEKINYYETFWRMDILGWWKGLIKFLIFLFPSIINIFLILLRFKKNDGRVMLVLGQTDKMLLTPLAKLLGIKIVWLEYADPVDILDRNFGFPKCLYSLAIEKADVFLSLTHRTKNKLLSGDIYRKKKVQVIPCGINILPLEKILAYKRNKNNTKKKLDISGKTVIGIISRIEEGKGQDTLIRTIPYLKKTLKNFVIVIAGDGDYRQQIKSLAKRLKVEEYVKFLGFYKNKYELISTFDIFVFPTRWKLEGFGLVSLEAMMMRVPLITSDLPVVKEVVGDSALISRTNPKDLAKNIIGLLKDEKLQKKLIKNGFKRVNSLYNIDKIADEYLRFID